MATRTTVAIGGRGVPGPAKLPRVAGPTAIGQVEQMGRDASRMRAGTGWAYCFASATATQPTSATAITSAGGRAEWPLGPRSALVPRTSPAPSVAGGRTPMCCLKPAKWKNRLLPECGHAAANASGRDRTQRRNTLWVSRRQGLAWPAAAAKYPSCARIACGLESQACGDVHYQRRGGWPFAPSGQSSTAAGGETTTPGCRNSSLRRYSEKWRSAHTNTINCNRLTSNAIR